MFIVVICILSENRRKPKIPDSFGKTTLHENTLNVANVRRFLVFLAKNVPSFKTDK